MIPFDDHLLPPSETPLDKALAAVSKRYEEMNAPTRAIWNPWTCPPDFLTLLAHAFSVDLWEEEWSGTRKRAIIANAIRMHREKGTEAGLRSYLYYTPGLIKSLLAPPQRVYSGPSPTKEAREAWLSRLPQVRVWRSFEQGDFGGKVFSGGPSAKMFVGGCFFAPSTAITRLKRRARWVVDGKETEERVSEFGSYFRLHRRGNLGDGAFCNSVAVVKFFIPSTASKRIMTVAPKQAAPWKTPIRASLVAVQSEPTLVKERGVAPASVFSGGRSAKDFFVPSTAWRRVYLRFPVDDESRPFRAGPSIQFMGLDRYGWPAHTARVKLSIPGALPDIAVGEANSRAAKRFWIPSDAAKRIDKTRRGMIAAKRASDVLQMDFTGRKTLIAGLDIVRAGVDVFVL
jgi:phage tail-like protein